DGRGGEDFAPSGLGHVLLQFFRNRDFHGVELWFGGSRGRGRRGWSRRGRRGNRGRGRALGLGLVRLGLVQLVLGDLFADGQRRNAVFAVRPVVKPALAVVQKRPDEPEAKREEEQLGP